MLRTKCAAIQMDKKPRGWPDCIGSEGRAVIRTTSQQGDR